MASEGQAFDVTKGFPWTAVWQTAVALLIYWQYTVLLRQNRMPTPAFMKLSAGTMCFGGLMLVYAGIEALSIVFPSLFLFRKAMSTVPPATVPQWISFLLLLVGGAFYEEALYRVFMPEAICALLKAPALKYAAEAGVVIVFALSHRYLGTAAVVNAILCGVILRLCFRRTKSIVPGTAAHILYNFMQIVFALISVSP